MKIIAFIPSRHGSKRFPGKPLATIAGKPMVERVYQCVLACREVSEVYVATDDRRIFDCVQDFNGKAVMTRPDHPSGTDRIAEAANRLKLHDEDIVINVQGDQPLFAPGILSDLIAPFRKDPAVYMSTLKHRIRDEREIRDKNYVKVVADRDGFALYFSRSPVPCFRETADSGVYFRHLGFYAYRKRFLDEFAGLRVGELESAEKLEQLRALEYGFKIKVEETSFDSVEVDAPQDIRRVEEIIASQSPQ